MFYLNYSLPTHMYICSCIYIYRYIIFMHNIVSILGGHFWLSEVAHDFHCHFSISYQHDVSPPDVLHMPRTGSKLFLAMTSVCLR